MIFARTSSRTRRILIRTALAVAFTVLVGALIHLRVFADAPSVRCGVACTPTYGSSTPDRYVVLTFDDGPAGRATDEIMETLERERVPATFFLVGERILAHPKQARELVARGFEVGNHTFSHEATVHESGARIVRELNETNAVMEAATGHAALLYRPPYLTDLAPFEVVPAADEHYIWRAVYDAGYVPIGVDLDSDDWEVASKEEALVEVRSALAAKAARYYGRPQHIFLFHDNEYTAEALPEIIRLIRAEGYEIVPLTTALGVSRDAVMPVATMTPGVVSDRILLAAVAHLSSVIEVLTVFVSMLAVARIAVFVWLFVARRREGVSSLPTFPGTVSVLIPAYNEAENIRATIMSVLGNTRVPDEVIVIDDGSTDATLAVARDVATQYPLVRVVAKENGGKSSALNLGLVVAQGEVVVAIDSDTVLAPDCIDALIRPFSAPRIGATAGKVVPALARKPLERYQLLEYLVGQNIDKEVISTLGSVHVVPGAVGAWRRTALHAVGGYSDETLVEDQDLTLALLGRNYGVVYVPEAVAYTEAPSNIRSFYLQRLRWTYGTFQCLYKYRAYLFGDRALRLGWFALPYAVTFSVLVPIVALALNLSIILGTLLGTTHPNMLFFLFVFTAVDILYAYLGLFHEPKASRPSVWLVPFQRFVYLFVYSAIVLLVVLKIADGTPTRWHKLQRTGAAQQHFFGVAMSGQAA